MYRYFASKRRLIAALKDRDKTIYELKKTHRLELFKIENKAFVEKFKKGDLISDDVMIIGHRFEFSFLANTNAKEKFLEHGFFGGLASIILSKGFEIPPKPVLIFECLDLKNKKDIELTLEEIQKFEVCN